MEKTAIGSAEKRKLQFRSENESNTKMRAAGFEPASAYTFPLKGNLLGQLEQTRGLTASPDEELKPDKLSNNNNN